ncbi:NAD-dependent succinate-semialdehyde dehydrogenase [Sphingosinicella microcystinivorans]|uniref:NAD-dependent succinate-semialdehyde dehydrogenase n=1 Tax=Sphingosinicella microcystinivorans TaxID=335406 RepID=UPI0022F3B1D2|nr:NAD-dependent succinate-semialdehyde dehydrogenase [Sphingosinicella microcystinivorans]WBX84516.1 NAD-dependent succinate-semialdehyde dehydrogenase [Sphingosinicella microcystinivorans]
MQYMKESCLIGGAWVGSASGERMEVLNPATGERIGTVPRCGRSETAQAIAAAHEAFPGWRDTPAQERAALMMKLHDLILANREALGRLLTAEMGKPLAEAVGEITLGAAYLRWFAEEARRVYGEIIPSPWRGRQLLVTREPVGVVGAITPWNFPSSMIGRKLGAALGAGCTMVAKPASQTPYSALALGALAEEAGLPPGILNIVTGSASEIAAEMCENPQLRKITFTGSTEVGKRLASRAMAHMKRVSMELGGNAPFIVFDDADLDRAVEGAMVAKFRNAGQTCVCANRLLVQSGIYDAFAAKLAEAMRGLHVGNGLQPGITQGPLIDAAGVAKVEDHIADAVEHGARVALGGRRHALGGTFFEPTLLLGVTGEMLVACEETFGPLAPLFRFADEAEALRLANATEYGLAAYVYTRDLGRAFRMMQGLDYGLVGVNEGLITTEVAPFGGHKDSGIGVEGSRHGIDDYTQFKYACVGGLA